MDMKKKVVVIGAGGRMGRHIIKNVLQSDKFILSGAVECAGHPALGNDAGVTAGQDACGVKITDEISAENVDVVINFSTGNVIQQTKIFESKKIPCVIGTTALSEDEKQELVNFSKNMGIVFAPNMSVGVNLLFSLSRKASEILGNDFDIEIFEIHHNQKKDAPSGTAVRLAEILAESRKLSYENEVVHGRCGMVGARKKNEIGVHALRGGDVVGEHTVVFAAQGERVELTHKASSRDTFAKGALRAAEFLLSQNKPGLFDMQDVLGLK